MASKLAAKTIPIIRMDCPTCIPVLEREISRMKGVDEAQGNYVNKTIKVTYDPKRVKLEDIEAAIERLGYQIAYKKYPGVISRLTGLLRGKKADDIAYLTDDDFHGKVLQAMRPVVVLFSSPTCPTCLFFKRQFKKIAEKVKDEADLYGMNIASTETWRRYNILSIPTVLVFRNGQLSKRFEAPLQAEDIVITLEND